MDNLVTPDNLLKIKPIFLIVLFVNAKWEILLRLTTHKNKNICLNSYNLSANDPTMVPNIILDPKPATNKTSI